MISRLKLFAIVALVSVACKSNNGDDVISSEKGALSLTLNPTSEIVEVTSSKSSGYVTLSDFVVDITTLDGVSYVSYGSYDDIPAQIALPEGSYTVKAETSKFYSAAYDSPYFYGSDQVVIQAGSTETVELICAIANVKVSVDYSDELLNTLEDIVVTISSKYDASDLSKIGVLKFAPLAAGATAEYEAGWFAVPYNGELEVYVTAMNKITGVGVTSTSKLQSVAARQWRKVTIDLVTSGSLGVDITIDDSLEEQDDVDVVIPDSNDIIDNNGDNGNWDEKEEEDKDDSEPSEPTDPTVDPVPTVDGAALGTSDNNAPFDIDEVIYFKISEGYDKLDVVFESTAEGGFTNLKLEIESTALTSLLAGIGITGEIDLANPDTTKDWYSLFCTLGLIDANVPIIGKTQHTFAVGGLMSLLWEVIEGSANESDTHLFHITPVDANGENAKVLSVVLE